MAVVIPSYCGAERAADLVCHLPSWGARLVEVDDALADRLQWLQSLKTKRLLMKADVSIIIPVYNEEETIAAVLERVLAVDFGECRREVVAVDDGSTDKTRTILSKFENREGVRILYRNPNCGKGAAVKAGIKESEGRAVIIQDADLEYEPEQIPMLVKPILEGKSKVVYGSRFLGTIARMTFLRKFANRWLTAYVNLLFGSRITDACTCYKAFDAEVLKSFHLQSDGFEICHELTANTLKRGLYIQEVPINYRARDAKEGVKSSWRDLVKQVVYMLVLRIRLRLIHKKVRQN